ncbi:general secretion pathway protein GspK [Candidatus Magnetominusculus xianensis]|uniref:General secretion pathway protein GspK n=1 Tax=Candidatus Magnetominusculus xianensis TaxID=1748249 RepID=A0ABR5SLI2_9BACT|nr:type II secretion system protein GspK [Candidatus Magnetominusculus xianensis]KWT90991.1 general secretion pathway protein GspK [Candidatus Magnetominusculus xianensis]MBF0403145.1 general secretion pathway protein GspK [Nitrospirota bacterium]
MIRPKPIELNEGGSAVLLTIFLASIIIIVGIAFNWLVKEHVKTAEVLKEKAEAMTTAISVFDTLLYTLLTGTLGTNRIHVSDSTIMGLDKIPINNKPIKIRDDITINVQDTNGRISVYSGTDSDFSRLVKLMDEKSNVTVITSSINDWIDGDDITRPSGAEAEYYRGIVMPYTPRNFSMQYMEELLLIRGMSWELYKKIKPYITVFPGTSGFNPATAEPMAVIASLDINEESRKILAEYIDKGLEIPDELFYNLTGRRIHSLEYDLFQPSRYLEVTVTYGLSKNLYTINAGLGLRPTASAPYALYYWKEG